MEEGSPLAKNSMNSKLSARIWASILSLFLWGIVGITATVGFASTALALEYNKEILVEADFSGRDLTDSSFTKANLRQSNFSHANLNGVSFFAANLESANLEGSDLRNATLDSARLVRANLTNALLEGAFAALMVQSLTGQILPIRCYVPMSKKNCANLPKELIPLQDEIRVTRCFVHRE
jgi:uncharacterized protein YjbI with pentapeptide repeats